MGVQHIVELLLDRTLEEDHVDFDPLAVGNDLVHLFQPKIDHVFE